LKASIFPIVNTSLRAGGIFSLALRMNSAVSKLECKLRSFVGNSVDNAYIRVLSAILEYFSSFGPF
jgi:hypothetical protein